MTQRSNSTKASCISPATSTGRELELHLLVAVVGMPVDYRISTGPLVGSPRLGRSVVPIEAGCLEIFL